MRLSLDAKLDTSLIQIVKDNIHDAALQLAYMNLYDLKMVQCVNTFQAARIVLNEGAHKVLAVTHGRCARPLRTAVAHGRYTRPLHHRAR